ncbi:hypothetical protein BJL90_00265 [Clostridium formicaceticum]|uniref:histidine kinase n=1 Tax=Clostridium formicaceticum TaxID=1497 RepID=A0ABN4T536_9CLOT|nr:hypothetical protein BJL90_00265 [Clostridium formicaceticum]
MIDLKLSFFSNVSHELKTPLNIILGTVQLLNTIHQEQEPLSCQHYHSVEKYIYMLKQNCYRLLRLIDNLIDITRIDTGFLKVNLKNQNIVSVIEDITLSVSEYIKDRGLNLIFDTEIEEKILACDSDKIERIMLNLLSNAIKFTNPNGLIKVHLYDGVDYIKITVKDNGVGIPADMKEKYFDVLDK